MSNTAQKIKHKAPISERISAAIRQRKVNNQAMNYIFIGKRDYCDLKSEMEPYMHHATLQPETETYAGLEIVVVDCERFLGVGIGLPAGAKAMSECDGNHALSDCDDLECWHDDNRRFNIWWYNEGSGLRPLRNEDASEHVRRVSRIAWLNGEYSQITKEDKP